MTISALRDNPAIALSMKLNVGCGRNAIAGWINLDLRAGPGVDIVFDLERCDVQALPLPDNSVGEFLLSHVLEHTRAPLPMMQELHRVSRPGASMVVRCPYGASSDADEDPTHVRRIFEGSFNYFSQPYYWKADYGYRGDWAVEKMALSLYPWVYENLPREEHAIAVRQRRNIVREIVAVLRAVKPIREPRSDLHRPFHCRIADASEAV